MKENQTPGRFPSTAEFLAALDVEAGWPPRFRKQLYKTSSKPPDEDLKVGQTGAALDRELRRTLISTALRAPEVQHHLTGRWSVLGVHRLSIPAPARREAECIRVCIFDYTRSVLIDVMIIDGLVEQVVPGMPHQHPESAMEARQAIAIARSHPDLTSRVQNLVPHAILRVPTNRESLSFGHRCIHVMFTENDDPHLERTVRFTALVDLTLQQVVWLGFCGCHDQGPNGHSQAGGETNGGFYERRTE